MLHLESARQNADCFNCIWERQRRIKEEKRIKIELELELYGETVKPRCEVSRV